MPEGDTIHRTANRLRPALEGATLERLTAPRMVGDRPRHGETIEAVTAVGKHLLISFSGGLTIETHMKMTGSWHLYRAGERWRKPERLARLIVDVGDWVAVCFSAPVVKVGPTGSMGRSDLGPDLCTADPDIEEAVRRAGLLGEEGDEAADLLLDQRIAAGVGNVFKSEVLWAERVSPFASGIHDDTVLWDRLLRRANKLLLANLGPGERTTVPGGLAVYGRRGKPCRRCGTPIERKLQGLHARSTYWCPRCQSHVDTSGRHPR